MNFPLVPILWITVMGILLFRAALVGDAFLRLMLNPHRHWLAKMTLWDLVLWQRIYKFLVDVILTLGFGGVIRLLIPGTQSAMVGAAVGLACSLLLTASGPYKNHLKRQYATSVN